MRTVPRDRFFPPRAADEAYADRAAPIGHGQTISQPYMVALMTQELHLQPDHKVLEIGTGSGYQTAILAKLVGDVFTVERVKPLLDEAFTRMMELSLRNVHFRFGDGTLGWLEEAPFDRILITAGAPQLPRDLLLNQLKDGGIAVLPVGPEDEQMLISVHRRGSELDTRDIVPCRFVKLIGHEGWQAESAE
jgi:protein-L-isoaspartate(D-aspartate) O-methyltransferase